MQQVVPAKRHAGAEPIPGYRLVAPLGSGGFGDVWLAEAPGGLHKAIKFVGDEGGLGCPGEQERAALELARKLRHPFLLALDRIEVVDGVLVVVMELADESLHEVCAGYRAQGLPGVPRDELLGYLLEAAEALDWMHVEHGLQHLDVKPHNLFLISGHVKVADFGLVSRLGDDSQGRSELREGGATPLYSAPETLRGTLSCHSDQYSLAVVYQQMLTGTVPFPGGTPYELMMQHLSAEPDLAALPPPDRPVVARALAKVPQQRYPSCLEFLHGLLGQTAQAPRLRRSGAWRLPVQASGPVRAEPVASAPAPTAVSLPGYRFLRCLSQGPLGDVWRAVDSQDRPRRALCLLGFVRYDERLIGHLRALADAALPPTEVHWSQAERLIVLTDCGEQSLRERFERCQSDGLPGVPRAELLRLLRSAAEALDGLTARHGLPHLGLNPRNLFVQGDRLLVADYGLVPLAWLPTGQSAAVLNPRYAAPELYELASSERADQYSLALVYAEMLTGANPRPLKAGLGAPDKAGRTSGLYRVVRPDLDLLPAHDRPAMLRALAADPATRFPSCTALVEALEAEGQPTEGPNLYHTLPAVIPAWVLLGEPPRSAPVQPGVTAVVAGLAAADPRLVRGPMNARYYLQPDGSWEYRCPVSASFAGVMPLKVEGFRQHWRARWVDQEEGRYRMRIEVPGQRTFWERCLLRARWVEVDVCYDAAAALRGMTEATVRVRYPGKLTEAEPTLVALAPRLFESIRVYLQVPREQRARERFPLRQPLRVYPVQPDLSLGEVLEATGQDVSYGGVRFRAAHRPPTEYVYLHLYAAGSAREHALLAQVVHAEPTTDGVEVGTAFVEHADGG